MRGICVAVLLAGTGCNLVFELDPVDGLQHTAQLEQRFLGGRSFEDLPRELASARYLVLDDTAASGYRAAPAVIVDDIIGSPTRLPPHLLEVLPTGGEFPVYFGVDVPHLHHLSTVLGPASRDTFVNGATVRWQVALSSPWEAIDDVRMATFGAWGDLASTDFAPVAGSTTLAQDYPWQSDKVQLTAGATFGRLTPDDVLVLARYRTGITERVLIDTEVASIDQRGDATIAGTMTAATPRTVGIVAPARPMADRVAAIPGFDGTSPSGTQISVRAIPWLAEGNRVGLRLGGTDVPNATSVSFGAPVLDALAWTPTFAALTFAPRGADGSSLVAIGEQLVPIAPNQTSVSAELTVPFVESIIINGSTVAADLILTQPPGPLAVQWFPDDDLPAPDLYAVTLVERVAVDSFLTRAVFVTNDTRVLMPGELAGPGIYSIQITAYNGLPGAATGDLVTQLPNRGAAFTPGPLFIIGP